MNNDQMYEPRTPRKLRNESIRFGFSGPGSDLVSSTPSQRLKPSKEGPLSNYALGDCLGKGAFASVYRALNLITGETVAVKQIKLIDVDKNDLDTIMLEIDLLKNLNHPNIVKYHGFVKTTDTLNIILEYCENGSLSNICKKFGKFPESLAAMYISQVLQGLVYLHEQGAVHRDIKGANILTTKDGNAKLADFGVATKVNKLGDRSVAGTPNWMAPEIIELNGATTSSDIWSLGCTVLELLTGKPPYHNLGSMPAMFAIVNDDHPPIPEGLSLHARDFLLQCFQKDPNLRISAKKLLRHPWIVNIRNDNNAKNFATARYDEAVKTVLMWNQAINAPIKNKEEWKNHRGQRKSEEPGFKRKSIDLSKYSEQQENINPSTDIREDPFNSIRQFSRSKQNELRSKINYSAAEISWDYGLEGNFDQKINSFKSAQGYQDSDLAQSLKANQSIVQASLSAGHWSKGLDILGEDSPFRDQDNDDYSDLIGDVNISKFIPSASERSNHLPPLFNPSDITALRSQSSSSGGSVARKPLSLKQYYENDEDADFSNAFDEYSGTSNAKMLISRSVIEKDENADSDDEDPFDMMENNSDSDGMHAPIRDFLGSTNLDLVSDIARDQLARYHLEAEELVQRLNFKINGSDIIETANRLLNIVREFPETNKTVMKCHGLLPVLEILEIQSQKRDRKHLVLVLLQLANEILKQNYQALENFCLIGGISVMTTFASKMFTEDIRRQAALFVGLLCNSHKVGLQMLMSCGGLHILSSFLEEDYQTEKDIVNIGISGLYSVFELQGAAPRNDICRILSKSQVLDSLCVNLSSILRDKNLQNNESIDKIVSIFVFFSQTESYVKESIASRGLFRTLFKCYGKLKINHKLSILKFVKNLSTVQANFSTLQNANAIEHLVEILESTHIDNPSRYTDIASQILPAMYNLCRLDKSRQEEAAVNGIVPFLQEIAAGNLPLRQFALPILCDMANASKTCRRILWQHGGLDTYLQLVVDPFWSVNAYEAIAVWLQDEVARVEEKLLEESSIKMLLAGFEESKANSTEALIEGFHKILRTSPALCRAMANNNIFIQIKRRLRSSKALIRLNILKLARTVLDATPNKFGLLEDSDLLGVLETLALSDSTVLVKELAKEILASTDINKTEHEFQQLQLSPSRAASKSRSDRNSRTGFPYTRLSPPRLGSDSFQSEPPPTPSRSKPRINRPHVSSESLISTKHRDLIGFSDKPSPRSPTKSARSPTRV